MPLPSSIATLAFSSFCACQSCEAHEEKIPSTHGILGERIRHASNVALSLATNLDKDGAEAAELAGHGGFESPVILGFGKTTKSNCQTHPRVGGIVRR